MGMWQGAGRPGYTRLHAVGAILVRPFRVWWRVACGAVHVARGRVVVFDRYTYDALLPITGSWRALKRPYFWVLAHLAPRPDLVLVLDLPGEVAFARKGEFTPEGLEAVRQGFLALVPRLGRRGRRRGRSAGTGARRRRRPDLAAPPRRGQVRPELAVPQPTSTGSADRSPVSSSTRATGDPALTRSASGAPCARPASPAPPAAPPPRCSRSPCRAGRRRARPGPSASSSAGAHGGDAVEVEVAGHPQHGRVRAGNGGDRRRCRAARACARGGAGGGAAAGGTGTRNVTVVPPSPESMRTSFPTACSTCTPRPRCPESAGTGRQRPESRTSTATPPSGPGRWSSV